MHSSTLDIIEGELCAMDMDGWALLMHRCQLIVGHYPRDIGHNRISAQAVIVHDAMWCLCEVRPDECD